MAGGGKIHKVNKKVVSVIPNVLSVGRIFLSILTLFFLGNKEIFTALYLLAGFTDALDGFLARKLKAESVLGARLDSIGDFFLFNSIVVYLLSQHYQEVVGYIYIIGGVFLVKLAGLVVGYVKFRKLIMIHTLANKTSGLLVFLLPFIVNVAGAEYLSWIAVFATLAAMEELVIIVRSDRRTLDLNQISVFAKSREV